MLKEVGDEYIIEINNDEHDTYEELKDEAPKEQEKLLPEKAPAVKLKGIKRKVEEGPKKKSKAHDVNISKSEVITDDQPSNADKETNALPKRRKKNVYVDMKLARVPDLNPYAKKAQSFRKNRRGEVEEAAEENLAEEIQVNLLRSLHEPYCNICEILLERKPDQNLMRSHEAKVSESSVPIPQQSMVWIPRPESTLEGTANQAFPVSRLLVCSRCKVCVHEVCYGSDGSENWMCDKCAAPEKITVTCYICKRTGGALKKTSGGEFFHFRCAVLIPELSRLSDVDLNLIPSKRWNLQCLICDRSGTEPAVHCMASRECRLSFHISCAETHAMDCVLGPENAVILRCSFCVEKFKLKEEEEIAENKFPPQDIQIGETVTVLNHPGFKTGTVTAVDQEKLYAITFDDGSFCDSVDPDSVTVAECELKDGVMPANCPVLVNWEGENTSGIYRQTNVIFWYSVRARKKKKVLELARSDLHKVDQKRA